jgi:hypothetical protein
VRILLTPVYSAAITLWDKVKELYFEPRGKSVLLPTPLAQDQALRALSDIRSAIDRSTRYSTFSALSGYLAGIAAIVGSGVCGMYPDLVGAQPRHGLRFVAVWAIVFVIAALSQTILTALKARRRGEAIWTPIARTAFAALLGPGLAGVAGSIVFVQTERWDLLPGVWLLFYGCGLWSVSFFAPLFLRVLGVGFLALGLGAWLNPDAAALWLGLGFGGLHLIFGTVVLARYRR